MAPARDPSLELEAPLWTFTQGIDSPPLSEALDSLCRKAALVQLAVNKRGIFRTIFGSVSPGRDFSILRFLPKAALFRAASAAPCDLGFPSAAFSGDFDVIHSIPCTDQDKYRRGILNDRTLLSTLLLRMPSEKGSEAGIVTIRHPKCGQ